MLGRTFIQRLRTSRLILTTVFFCLACPAWATAPGEESLPGEELVQSFKKALQYHTSKRGTASFYKWRHAAAESGHLQAQVELCVGLLQADLLYEAKRLCRRAAKAGDPEALFALSYIYRVGTLSLEPNADWAKDALRRAAARGFQPAIDLLTRVEGEKVRTEDELDAWKTAGVNEIRSIDWGLVTVFAMFAVLAGICIYTAYKTAQRAMRSATWRIVVLMEMAMIVSVLVLLTVVESAEMGGSVSVILFVVVLLADGAVLTLLRLFEKRGKDGQAVSSEAAADSITEMLAGLWAVVAHSRYSKRILLLVSGVVVIYVGALAVQSDPSDLQYEFDPDYVANDASPAGLKLLASGVPEADKVLDAYQKGLLTRGEFRWIIDYMGEHGSARRHDWVPVAKYSDGRFRVDLYVDYRSVLDDTVWVMTSQPQLSYKHLLRVDCQNKTIKQIGKVSYSKPIPEGQPKEAFSLSDANRVLPKESIFQSLFTTELCKADK